MAGLAVNKQVILEVNLGDNSTFLCYDPSFCINEYLDALRIVFCNHV